jgi:hypothetical protein
MPKRLEILRAAGFTGFARPVMWIEKTQRQAFSEAAVSDHNESWLVERLAQLVPDTEFWFYFRYLSRDPLKDCKSILSRLRMTAILPIVRDGIFRPGQLVSN